MKNGSQVIARTVALCSASDNLLRFVRHMESGEPIPNTEIWQRKKIQELFTEIAADFAALSTVIDLT
jgi:hypothetical protein